jgi:hypothetical protein
MLSHQTRRRRRKRVRRLDGIELAFEVDAFFTFL